MIPAVTWVPASELGGDDPLAFRADFPHGYRGEVYPLACCAAYPHGPTSSPDGGGWAWAVFTSADEIATGWNATPRRAKAAAMEAATIIAESSDGPPPEGTERRYWWRQEGSN